MNKQKFLAQVVAELKKGTPVIEYGSNTLYVNDDGSWIVKEYNPYTRVERVKCLSNDVYEVARALLYGVQYPVPKTEYHVYRVSNNKLYEGDKPVSWFKARKVKRLLDLGKNIEQGQYYMVLIEK